MSCRLRASFHLHGSSTSRRLRRTKEERIKARKASLQGGDTVEDMTGGKEKPARCRGAQRGGPNRGKASVKQSSPTLPTIESSLDFIDTANV